MAERGTVVEGRIGGQADDRFPQPGEAFRQILHVGGGFAGAGPGFLQEAAGIGPAAGRGGELVFVAGRCEGYRASEPPGMARRGGGDARRKRLPRTSPEPPRRSRPPPLLAAPHGREDRAEAAPAPAPMVGQPFGRLAFAIARGAAGST